MLAAVAVLVFSHPATPPEQVDSYHGLAVGQPKLVDPRDLESRIRVIQQRLSTLSFIDQASIVTAIGKIQGAEAEARAISLGTNLMLPYTLIEDVTKSVSASGKDKVTERTETTSRIQEKPSAPTVNSNAQSAALPTLQFSARDIMREQLQMELNNLGAQLSLIRNLGDRMHLKAGQKLDRHRAILSLPLSIEAKEKNAVADFEITLTFTPRQASEAQGAVQVIGLYPESTSYNKSVYSEQSSGFSGSAVVQPIGISASSTTNSKAAFLVQDQDLIAFLMPNANKDSLKVKYQVRPVLSRQTVEAGVRHVLIDVSLPFPDTSDYTLKTEVSTYWSFYDRGRGRTTGLIRGTKRVVQCNIQDVIGLGVNGVASFYTPTVAKVDWTDVGAGKFLVDVQGAKFLEGSSVLVGPTQFVQTGVSTTQNENHVSFISPASDLLTFGAQMLGRYGEATPILDYSPDSAWDANRLKNPKVEVEGIESSGDVNMVASFDLIPDHNLNHFQLQTLVPSSPLLRFALPGQYDIRLLLRSANRVYGTSQYPVRTEVKQRSSEGDTAKILLHFVATRKEALESRFELFRPFKPGKPVDFGKVGPSDISLGPAVDSVSVLTKNKDQVWLIAKGTKLDGKVKLLLGTGVDPDPKLVSSSSLVYQAKAMDVAEANNLAFTYETSVVSVLPFDGKKLAPPEEKPPIVVPTMDSATIGGMRFVLVQLPEYLRDKLKDGSVNPNRIVSASLADVDLQFGDYRKGEKATDLVKGILIDLSKPRMVGEHDIKFTTFSRTVVIGRLKVLAPPRTTSSTETSSITKG